MHTINIIYSLLWRYWDFRIELYDKKEIFDIQNVCNAAKKELKVAWSVKY